MTDYKKEIIEPLQHAKSEYKQRYIQAPYSMSSEEVMRLLKTAEALEVAIDVLTRKYNESSEKSCDDNK